MKTSFKLSLAIITATFALTAHAHPGHEHNTATANVVHAIDGVATTDQDKVAKAEQTTTKQVKHAEKKAQKVQK